MRPPSERKSDSIFRYPGPVSFEDSSNHERLFFGREYETKLIVDTILAERTLVLFGVSGVGKTSILQAGVFPRLRRKGFLPVPVRFNHPVEHDESESLCTNLLITEIKQSLALQIEKNELVCDGWLDATFDLREFFARLDIWNDEELLVPVLVFDQFEEIFTIQDRIFRTQFLEQLTNLLSLFQTGVDGDAEFVQTLQSEAYVDAPAIRIVLSLREEWVGSLEAFSSKLPKILDHRIQLNSLTRQSALRAIREPAQQKISEELDLASPSFEYGSEVTEGVLDLIKNKQSEYDPFQLQLVCRHIEQQIIGSGEVTNSDNMITMDSFGGMEQLSRVQSNYYDECLRGLKSSKLDRKTSNLCEGLLNYESRRISQDESTVRGKYKLKKDQLDKILETRLIRATSMPRLEGLYYEISHDLFTQPIEDYKKRKNKKKLYTRLGVVTLLSGIGIGYLFILLNQRLQDKAQDYAKLLVVLPNMVTVQGGEFRIGANGFDKDELPPEHSVKMPTFKMSDSEITYSQYDAYILNKFGDKSVDGNIEVLGDMLPRDYGWGRGEIPVLGVTWLEAQNYTEWLSEQLRKLDLNHAIDNDVKFHSCSLPSEAEWEYAALDKGGNNSYWDPDNAESVAWLHQNSSVDGVNRAHPVKQKKPNELGIYDMAGNAWEWVQDCENHNYQNFPADGSAVETGNCDKRAVRGGSFYGRLSNHRATDRGFEPANQRYQYIGFRVVCRS